MQLLFENIYQLLLYYITGRDFPVRLVGGRSDNEGRVEIKHGGEWTTVCDQGWDKRDADIICHQLGYGSAVRATSGANYGQGTGEILLSNVKCKRDDLRFRYDVRYCNVTDWYPSTDECTHADDAGVECETDGRFVLLLKVIAHVRY